MTPYDTITDAINAMVAAQRSFVQQLETQADALLERRSFWRESAAILDAYTATSAGEEGLYDEIADDIRIRRMVLHTSIIRLAKDAAIGDLAPKAYRERLSDANDLIRELQRYTISLAHLVEYDKNHAH